MTHQEKIAQHDEAYGYLSRLFKHVAPQCEPLSTLVGVCTQIDNYIAGLERDTLLAAPRREPSHTERVMAEVDAAIEQEFAPRQEEMLLRATTTEPRTVADPRAGVSAGSVAIWDCRICGFGVREGAALTWIRDHGEHYDTRSEKRPNKGTAYCPTCSDETLRQPLETPLTLHVSNEWMKKMADREVGHEVSAGSTGSVVKSQRTTDSSS